MDAIFVSYRRPQQADAEALRRRLAGRLDVTTHSVAAVAEATWRAECRRLIGAARAVVCIVGEETADSPNVDWELEVALGLGRPVFALRGSGARAPRLPGPLAERGTRLLDPDELDARLRAPAYERAG